MVEISGTSSDDWQVDLDTSSESATTKLSSGASDLVILMKYDDSNGGNGGSNGGSGGSPEARTDDSDGADTNGLYLPTFNSNINEVLLTLGSKQSDTAQSQIQFSSKMVESFQDEVALQCAKNIDKLAKMREAAKNAQFWTDMAKSGGYTGVGLTALAGVLTANPVLVVSSAMMLTTICMNETGATEAIMDSLGPVAGTIVLALVIGAASFATGGVAGMAMFSTLSSGLLATPENLENLGVSSDAAVWLSMGIGVGASLVSGFAMARMATVGTQAAGLADDAAGLATKATSLSDDAAKLGTQAAEMGDDAAQLANSSTKVADSATKVAREAQAISDDLATGAKDSASIAKRVSALADDATQLADDAAGLADDAANAAQGGAALDDVAKSAQELNEAAQDVIRNANKVVKEASQSSWMKLAKWPSKGHLEKALQAKLTKLVNGAYNMSGGSSVVTAGSLARLGAYTTMASGIVDLFTGALSGVTTAFNYEVKVLQADAELADAESDYASDREDAWTAMYAKIAESFDNKMDMTSEAIATCHAATKGHQQFAV